MFNRHKTLSGGGNYGLFSVKFTLIFVYVNVYMQNVTVFTHFSIQPIKFRNTFATHKTK